MALKQIPVNITLSNLSAEDKEQISLLFENPSRTLYNLLLMKFGKAVADSVTLTVTQG